jgi:hypothetical protein
MVTVSLFVTLMTVYQSVWHHTIEDCNLDCKSFVTKCLNLYVLTSTELKHLSVSVSSESVVLHDLSVGHVCNISTNARTTSYIHNDQCTCLLVYVLAVSAHIPFPKFPQTWILCQLSICGLQGFDAGNCRYNFEHTTACSKLKLWMLCLCELLILYCVCS